MAFRLILLSIVATAMPLGLDAQYSRDVFSLKKSSDLYDERGYQQGKSISVDGRLITSNSNGNVSYSYPISSQVISGYPLNVTLNYCGSVAFTAFKDFASGVAPGASDDVDPESYPVYGGWSKFHQNRPAWILGVNGFAIQVISSTSQFHCSHDLMASNKGKFTDTDFVWCVDGYDFCNRMADLVHVGNGSHTLDVIKLLREDGSVLELLNARKLDELSAGTSIDNMPEYYTGYYYVNEANNKGFAYVEFDDEYFPGYISGYTGGADVYRPRKVHYYPGDGLEYVFREWVIPFGLRPYTDNYVEPGGLWPAHLYGSALAGPTIFYLEELRCASGLLTEFKRTRHYPLCLDMPVLDSTKGRALITEFADHTIEYAGNSLAVNALGRRTTVFFDKVAVNGGADALQMPIAEKGYMGPTARTVAGLPENTASEYVSYLGLVTKIVDAEDRATTFDYEPYTRIYTGYGFPQATSDSIVLRNWRLKEIHEPSSTYTIGYWKSNPFDFTAPPGLQLSDTGHLVAGADDPDPFYLNNLAKRIEKYDRDGNLLSWDSCSTRFESPNTESFPLSFTKTTVDNVTGQRRIATYEYGKRILPHYVPWSPRGRYTELLGSSDSTDVYATATQIMYDSLAPYLVLPVSQIMKAGAPGNLVTKSQVTTSYVVGVVRDFEGDNALAEYFGRDVKKKIANTIDPGSTGVVLLRDTTEYLHLPLVRDTTIARTERRYDKIASMQNYADGGFTEPWIGIMYDSTKVAVYNWVTEPVELSMPPVFDLVRRHVVADQSGTILGGVVNSYQQSAAQKYLLAARARIVADTTIGTGGAMLPGSTYFYGPDTSWGANLPIATVNALGAVQLRSYGYSLLGSASTHAAGSIKQNNDQVRSVTLNDGEFFSTAFGQPAYQEQRVRRSLGGLSITADTLSQSYERTYHGQTSASIDANGWYSRFDYDKNGRLKMATLPYDFQGVDSQYVYIVTGEDTTGFSGDTRYTVVDDTVVCDGPPNLTIHTTDVLRLGALYADDPPQNAPVCAGQVTRKKDAPAIQGLGTRIPYSYLTPAIATMYPHMFPVTIEQIIALDSARLELPISSVIGECVNLTVDVPALGISQTFVLNCPNPPTPAPGTVVTGSMLKIDLTPAIPTLLTYGHNQTFQVKLSTSTSAARVEIGSGYYSDERPELILKGVFKKVNKLGDYTITYNHDDDALTSSVKVKVDDYRHTANILDQTVLLGESRRSAAVNYFGADYRVLRTENTVVKPNYTTRVDTALHSYTGLGAKTRLRDQDGDTSATRYDAAGRPIELLNGDGTGSTVTYEYGTPSAMGITGQNFHGWCMKRTTTGETGIRTVEYYDAFDRKRREVVDMGTGGLNLTTRYNYDLLGRLTDVTNPRGDAVNYVYDAFGRVRYKSAPDLGTISYAYDKLGNVRFTQTREQAAKNLLNFTEYDDLNRPTLIGQAIIAREDCHAFCEDSLTWDCPPVMEGTAGRLTDQYDPDHLHVSGLPASFLTTNPTLLSIPVGLNFFHVIGANINAKMVNCTIGPNPILNESSAPVGPLLEHPTQKYVGCAGTATASDFEDMGQHLDFARIAINYDRLPTGGKTVWAAFPPNATWNALAPTGAVRNLKGHEAAVAYRERSSEPFHYNVLSYDERGRVEAILRCNDNLGFDAVYYAYNSMNQVTSVTVADPMRQFTTWYGYDFQGRIDSVWTLLGGVGTGLVAPPAPPAAAWPMLAVRKPTPLQRPAMADIVYSYTKTGQVAQMLYPTGNALVDYAYNHRKWLDSLVARQITVGGTGTGGAIFKEALAHDASGQITSQRYKHGTLAEERQSYGYDGADRLTWWTKNGDVDTTFYAYDAVGNRLRKEESWDTQAETYTLVASANQLDKRRRKNLKYGDSTWSYAYDLDGNTTLRKTELDSSTGTWPGWAASHPLWQHPQGKGTVMREDDRYSYRGLLNRVVHNNAWQLSYDWRYRYNASGEREQKRLYYSPGGFEDSTSFYPWVYYLLGGDNNQLAVYHGQQTRNPAVCTDTGRRVYMYPAEYLTYGVGSAMNITTSPAGVKSFKIADHLGSTRVLIAQGGGMVSSDYEPYGKQIGGAVTGERKSYIDRENDAETGNYNTGVRSEEPEEGRFLSVDPLWEKYPGLSPYLYGDNNPMRMQDPWGKQGWEEVLGVYAAEAAASAALAALTQYVMIQSLQPVPLRGVGVAIPEARDLTPSVVPLRLNSTVTLPVPPTARYDGGSAFGWGIVLMAAEHQDEPEQPGTPPPAPGPSGERNPAQDKMLTEGEIKALKAGGVDIHDLKGGEHTGQIDLYKDVEGNIYIKGKGGKGPGEPTYYNVNDYK